MSIRHSTQSHPVLIDTVTPGAQHTTTIGAACCPDAQVLLQGRALPLRRGRSP
jgi:hypothetical protein